MKIWTNWERRWRVSASRKGSPKIGSREEE